MSDGFFLEPGENISKTRMHSIRVHTTLFSGCLSCHACPPCHICPPSYMSPTTHALSCHTCPLLSCMPPLPCMPLPHMPPTCYTCPPATCDPAMHAPCYACPSCHARPSCHTYALRTDKHLGKHYFRKFRLQAVIKYAYNIKSTRFDSQRQHWFNFALNSPFKLGIMFKEMGPVESFWWPVDPFLDLIKICLKISEINLLKAFAGTDSVLDHRSAAEIKQLLSTEHTWRDYTLFTKWRRGRKFTVGSWHHDYGLSVN